MTDNKKIVGLLNDLIQINNDRVVGYEKAIDELKADDADLKMLFQRYTLESKQFTNELTQEVTRLGGDPSDGTTNSGKIYRVWMDLKAAISGKDRKTILDNCEFGEDAALKAYRDAQKEQVSWPTGVAALIEEQREGLQRSHDTIKRLRDMYVAAH